MLHSHKVALNIRSCRESRGYSQEYMAEMLDICQSAYANLELGKTALSLDRLFRISEILETNIHDLIESDISPRPSLEKEEIPAHAKHFYDQLILELKSEIEFLRDLVKEKHA